MLARLVRNSVLLVSLCAPGLATDGGVQQAYIKASNTDPNDEFGGAIAISGDTAVVGARLEASSAHGVNGDQSSNGSPDSGAVYVFERSGSSWSQQAYIKAPNPNSGDEFGFAVALSGDTLVVGAPREGSNSPGVNGSWNNLAPNSGAAYVYVRNGSNWNLQAYLKASNTESNDQFGTSVVMSGDTVVVGTIREQGGSCGVNGDDSDNSKHWSGAAYVFVRSGTTWSQEAYLKASNCEAFDYFGWSLAIQDDTLLVGAVQESSAAAGVNGDESNNDAAHAGAAYVFTRTGTTWSQEAYLKASNPEAYDSFGNSLDVYGDRAVIGAPHEASGATGVDGDQSDNSENWAGAAYVFDRTGTSWTQQAYLKASNTGSMDSFGASVALDGDRLVAGASFEASNATGIDGDESSNGADRSGAAYAFEWSGTSWSQQAYIKASNTDPHDFFGRGVVLLGDTLLVGASEENGAATGVNGDQGNGAANAGAVYAFDLDPAEAGDPICFGDPGSGTPCPCDNDNDGSTPGSGCDNGVFASGGQLRGYFEASVSNDTLQLVATHLEPNNSGLFFQADNDLSPGTPMGDGLRCVGGGVVRIQTRMADAVGSSHTTRSISQKAGVLPGDTKYYQVWYRTNALPPCGYGVNDFNTTNGYRIVWLP